MINRDHLEYVIKIALIAILVTIAVYCLLSFTNISEFKQGAITSMSYFLTYEIIDYLNEGRL